MRRKNTGWFLISGFVVFILMGCNRPGEVEKNPKTKIDKQKPQNKTVKKPADPWIRITDANVEQVLTQYGLENKETLVLLKTPKGNLKIKLYENTPIHRANFIRLIKNDFYKGTLFYRVVNNFMIQGGDNDDWERASIKSKMGSYTLPAEFAEENIHKKGALSMARAYENNPELRSVSFEWFIVQGTKYTDGELLGAEQQYDLKISPAHKLIYKTIGGTPHLDGKHTVFGHVIEGFEVIDSIAAAKTDDGDWPIEDITITFQIID